MKFRIPLWMTLLPLLAGGIGWWVLWQDYAGELRSDLGQLLPEATDIHFSGFPYRLEARIRNLQASRQWDAVSGRVTAAEMTVHRVPWQRNRQVMTFTRPDVGLKLLGLDLMAVQLRAPAAIGSLHFEGRQIARLSMVWENPQIRAGFLSAPVRAEKFEAHYRESPAPPASTPATAAAGEAQADVVLAGEKLRFGHGDPVEIALRASSISSEPPQEASGGSASDIFRIESFTLSDATGEVLQFRGRLQPDANGRLQLQGEIQTFCPATVRAAVAGQQAPPEKRARKLQLLPVRGEWPQVLIISPHDPAKPLPPVRGQEPDCPRLR